MADNDKVQFQNVKNQQSKVNNKSAKQVTKPNLKIKAEDKISEEVSKQEKSEEVKKETNKEEKTEDKKTNKKQIKKPEVPKKTEAKVYGRNLRISLKHSKGVCNFIKGKQIEKAINDLDLVMKKKIAVPMKGELAHRKGKGISSGKYPMNASKEIQKLLNSLKGNCTMFGMELENTKISEAIPNKAPDRMHRFGGTKFKQTHITIKAKQSKGKI